MTIITIMITIYALSIANPFLLENIKYTLFMCHTPITYSVISDPIVYDEEYINWK